jgi:uncharacterized membrane protein YbhN (UPF0104 family)
MTRKKRRPARMALHGLVLATVLLAAWHFIDFGEFSRAIAAASLPWFLVLLGLATVDRFLMAGKWLQLLRHVGSGATFGAVLSAYYQVGFIQRFIPSSLSGDALRAFHISRQFKGTSGLLATMVVEKLVAMVAAIVLALAGLALVYSQRHQEDMWVLFAAVPLLLATVVVGLRLSLHRPLAEWAIRRLPARLRPTATQIYAHYASFGSAPRLISLHFFYCLVEQVVQVGMWLAAALAIGVETPVSTLFAALSVAQCIRKYAIIFEGWLFGEFTLVLICSMFGVPQSQALAFSLLAHAGAVIASLPGAFLFSRSAVSLADLRSPSRLQAAAQAP